MRRGPERIDQVPGAETEDSGYPVEIETKLVNIGSAEQITAKLKQIGAELVTPRRLLDDRRFAWAESAIEAKDSKPTKLNPGYFKDTQQLNKALKLMGFELGEGKVGKIWAYRKKHMTKRTVRVRADSGKTFFTVKEKRKNEADKIDHRHEVELEVLNESEIIEFLHSAGLVQNAHRQKYRATYRLNGCLVELNEPPEGIDPWIEIEGKNDKRILQTVELLGFNKDQLVSLSDKDYLISKGLSLDKASYLIFKK